jgi:KRAB domain-containing zinc finger protein
MSKKVSDFFNIEQKLNSYINQEKGIKEEQSFDIKSEIRECRVVLEDINNLIIKNEPNATQDHNTKITKKTSIIDQVKCKICFKKVQRRSLSNHLKNIHSKSLNQHLVMTHAKKAESKHFECDYDGKIFETKQKILSHMRSHQSKVKCELCDLMYIPKNLKRHLENFHAKGLNFQCKICNKFYKSKLSLKNHMEYHNKKFECKICSKMFSTQAYLNQHTKCHHKNPKSFQCEICDKKFNEKHSLKNHQKTHDINRIKLHKCQRCDFATDDLRYLKIHQKFHERQAGENATEKCKKCWKFCKNKKSLKRHIKRVHPDVKLQCDLCGKYINTKDYLKRHVLSKNCKKNKKFS